MATPTTITCGQTSTQSRIDQPTSTKVWAWGSYWEARMNFKMTRPDGGVESFDIRGNAGGYAEWIPTMNQLGNYHFEFLCTGEAGYDPSDICSFDHEVYVDKVEVQWVNVRAERAEVPPATVDAILGALQDTDGFWLHGQQLDVYVKDPNDTSFAYIQTITVLGGAFTADLVRSGNDLGQYTVRIVFAGDVYHYPSTYEFAAFTCVPAPEKENIFMLVYPLSQPPALPGTAVQLGVGVYVGDCDDCPPTCPPTCPLTQVVGTLSVKVKLRAPGASAFMLYKTVSVGASPWFETYTIPSNLGYGMFYVRYEFDGDAYYNAHSVDVSFIVGECDAPVYLYCPDGTSVMEKDCQSYHFVPTGLTCPVIGTTCQCPIAAEDGGGLQLLVGRRMIYHTQVIASGGPYSGAALGVLVGVEIKVPGGSWTHIADIQSGTAAHYYVPQAYGHYQMRFTFPGGVVSAIEYGPSECIAEFDALSCWPGQTAEPYVCEDGTTIYLKSCDSSGQWIDTGAYCPTLSCREAHPHSECQDGSLWDCVQDAWVDLNQPCVGCTEGAYSQPYVCPDGKTIYLQKCVNGEWVLTGQKCKIAEGGISPLLVGVGIVAGIGIIGYLALRRH